MKLQVVMLLLFMEIILKVVNQFWQMTLILVMRFLVCGISSALSTTDQPISEIMNLALAPLYQD